MRAGWIEEQKLYYFDCVKLKIFIGLTVTHPRYIAGSDRAWCRNFGPTAERRELRYYHR
jgi:hypothetical protein